MTLPASGQISFNDIRIELGIPTQSPFSLESASLGLYVPINTASPSRPNGTPPYAISEWYGYDHNAVVCTDLGTFSTENAIPADPSDCDPINVYNFGTFNLWSNCASPDSGCFIYTDSGCTTTAYSQGIRYFMDGAIYRGLATNSSVNDTGFCA